MIKKAFNILQNCNRPKTVVIRDKIIFRQLLNFLDNPHNSFKSVHITGTNGKGSTTLKIASVLEQAGYKTGVLTSPHISSIFERTKVNGVNIKEEFFAETIVKLHEIKEKHKLNLSFFEYLTATAFLYFKQTKCDFASIEVGLGGRFDTTNVITPEVSVITSIALDHENFLGNKRELIAHEKAGIIKNKVPVVVGPNAELLPIFEQANSKDSSIHLLEKKIFQTFQEENIAVSREVIKVLQSQGNNISQQAIQKGLQAKQPCRMELIQKDKLQSWIHDKKIILDVGHNPNAIVIDFNLSQEKNIEYFNKKLRTHQKQRITVIFGSSEGKNCKQSLHLLQTQFASLIYLVQAKHSRAQNIEKLKAHVGHMNFPSKFRVVSDGQIYKALNFALADKQTDTVLICGSFFMMSEVKRYLKIEQDNISDEDRSMSQNYGMINSSDKKG